MKKIQQAQYVSVSPSPSCSQEYPRQELRHYECVGMTSLHKNRGMVLVITLVFGALMIAMASSLVGYTTLNARSSRTSVAAVQARALAEAGIDKAVYQLNQDPNYAGETDTALGDGTFTVTIEAVDAATKRIRAHGYAPAASPLAHVEATVHVSKDVSVVSFHYGVQAGDGGFELRNNSTVAGNVYSNGPILGENSNSVGGDAVSAGAEGLVDGVNISGAAYAHTIDDSDISGDAYYVSISNSDVGGTEYPGSSDQATSTLPITDELVENWKTAAESGGTHTTPCPYEIDESMSLGPKKIDCDLKISGNSTILTLTGHVWVNGDLEIEGSPTIRVAGELGDESVAIIADKESDPANGGIVELQNSPVFEGSGASGSYVMVVSQNESAESGGNKTAINAKNSVSGDLLLHAGHGLISLENSIVLSEITAWKVLLNNTASVTYESGVASTLFSSGPGASWAVLPGTYTTKR